MTIGRGWMIAFVTVAFGCGGAESASPAMTTTSTSAARDEPETSAAPSGLPADPAAARTATAPPAPSSGPAFVVYTIAPGSPTRRSTVVVPFDPTIPVRTMPGIVVLDDATTPASLRWLTFADDAPCACDCSGASSGAESGEIVGIDPRTFELETDSACDPESCRDDEEAAEGDAEEEEACETAEETFATLVGGRVFAPLDTHLECEGANLYGNELRTFSITRAEWTTPPLPTRGLSCEGDHSAAGWPSVRHERAPLPCVDGRGGFRSRNRQVECDRCDGSRPGRVLARITRGMLQTLDVLVAGDGTGTAWLAETPLTATNCPSTADPCGDRAAFPALLAPPRDADFWVSTDGSAALLLSEDGTGRWKVATFGAGVARPTRSFDAGFDPSSVFGVRVHADVDRLARLIDHGLPGRRAAACRSESLATTTTTTCDAGSRPRDGGCVALPLDPSDVGFVDPRGGSEWGNRCVVHLRANALDSAEAACAAGLRVAERDTTRGAILYNLGLIARARGEIRAARAYFDRSFAARPGNRAVEDARAELGD